MSRPSPLWLVLLGAFLMTASPAHPAERPSTPKLLTDFTAATPDLGWFVVNDGVMGGRSRGGFTPTGDALDFRGSTNTDGGGFSSIRTRGLTLDLGAYDGIRVRVRGDGRRYTWRLTTDARWRGRQVGYWADLETKAGTWTTADIPWSAFEPQWRGRKLSDLPLDPRRIRGMGLMIYDKKDGPFALRLDRVEAYARAPAFRLADLRWTKRVLVLHAPSAKDPQLVDQLARVAKAQAGFDERDMLLVVLLETKGSRAGDRALTADEARALRRALGFASGAFGLRLIGKDGGVKRRADEPVAMQTVFAQIDAMPMRRAEMQRGDARR